MPRLTAELIQGFVIPLFLVGGAEQARAGQFGPPERWASADQEVDCSGVLDGGTQIVDVDGDRRVDLVRLDCEGNVNVALSTGANFAPAQSWVQSVLFETRFPLDGDGHLVLATTDVNDDRLEDLVFFVRQGVYVSRSSGAEFTVPEQWIDAFGAQTFGWRDAHVRSLADVNGDGSADAVGFGDLGVYVALGADDHFAAHSLWIDEFGAAGSAGGWDCREAGMCRLADVDGDGRSDIFGMRGVEAVVSRSTGTSFEPQVVWAPGLPIAGSYFDVLLVDVDGDHRDDLVYRSGQGLYYSRSTGDAFAPAQAVATGPSDEDWRWSAADLDDDGLRDLIYWSRFGVWVLRFDGHSFEPAQQWLATEEHSELTADLPYQSVVFADADGDGRRDLVAAIHWLDEGNAMFAGVTVALQQP